MQYAAVELFRGNMLRHSLILYRDDNPGDCLLPRFDDESWLTYVPIRLPEAMIIRKNLPPGADNETNCDEVQQDILGWLEAHLK